MEPMFDPLLTNEAARVLAVSPETVRFWERVGRLRAVKTASGLRLFDRRDVERLARDREARSITTASLPTTPTRGSR